MTRRATKTTERFITMCIPGRDESDAATWFVFDMQAFRSVLQAEDFSDARDTAAELNDPIQYVVLAD